MKISAIFYFQKYCDMLQIEKINGAFINMDTKTFKRLEKCILPAILTRIRWLRGIRSYRNHYLSLECTMVKWGFLGVDTFFVISGYLITSLLISEYYRTQKSIC